MGLLYLSDSTSHLHVDQSLGEFLKMQNLRPFWFGFVN